MAQDDDFTSVGLKQWPFHVVASRETATTWVGRPDLRRKVDRLSRGVGRVPNSQIVVLWASFGAGKTHAMMYLEHLLLESPRVSPLYVVTPRGVRGFVELYRVIADAALTSGAALKVGRKLLRGDEGTTNDVERALAQLASGNSERVQLAGTWLRADKTSARERAALGVAVALDSTGAAVDALQRLVHALLRDDQRVVLLIDEVQELAELGKKLDECMGGLHKLFDSTPSGLTLVLSFTTASQGTVQSILGDTLWDRVSQTISMPALTPDEAFDFLRELVAVSQVEDSLRASLFEDGSLTRIVKYASDSQSGITPRSVIKAADSVLREALPDLEDGVIAQIDEAFVSEVLHA